jgi:hypothetical protein
VKKTLKEPEFESTRETKTTGITETNTLDSIIQLNTSSINRDSYINHNSITNPILSHDKKTNMELERNTKQTSNMDISGNSNFNPDKTTTHNLLNESMKYIWNKLCSKPQTQDQNILSTINLIKNNSQTCFYNTETENALPSLLLATHMITLEERLQSLEGKNFCVTNTNDINSKASKNDENQSLQRVKVLEEKQ